MGIYWPLIFWLTHIPVPDVARKSGMSDKTMHALAYLALTFLVWLAVCPYRKVHWKHLSAWAIFVVVVGYAATDELLQSRVGRSADMLDFIADLAGVVLGMGILSILSFWPALLTISAIFIFAINNLSRAVFLFPEYHLDTVFHFTAYAALTLIWIQYDCRHRPPIHCSIRRLGVWLLLPLGILFFVKATGPAFHKQFHWIDMATAVFAISATVLLSSFVLWKKKSHTRPH